jgi:hypothetical protein
MTTPVIVAQNSSDPAPSRENVQTRLGDAVRAFNQAAKEGKDEAAFFQNNYEIRGNIPDILQIDSTQGIVNLADLQATVNGLAPFQLKEHDLAYSIGFDAQTQPTPIGDLHNASKQILAAHNALHGGNFAKANKQIEEGRRYLRLFAQDNKNRTYMPNSGGKK